MISLRKPGEADAEEIYNIEVLVQPNPWSRQQILSELSGRSELSFIAESLSPPALVGYLFARLSGDEAELLNVGVHRQFQRQGIARQLLTELVQKAPPQASIFLEVSHLNLPALKLYENFGFVEIGRRQYYYRDQSDAIVMAYRK